MMNKGLPKKAKVYIPLVVLLVLITFFMPRNSQFGYDYKKGMVWMDEPIVAQFDFPLLKSESEYQNEVAKANDAAVGCYRQDLRVANEAIGKVSGMEFGVYHTLKADLVLALSDIYGKSVLPPVLDASERASEQSDYIYIQKGKLSEKRPVSEVYTLDSARERLREVVYGSCPEAYADSLMKTGMMASIIVPDLSYDLQATELLRQQAVGEISRTKGVVRSNSVIVSNGETITAEVERKLDSYKAEYYRSVGYNGNVVFMWVGNALLALALVVVLFFALFFCNPSLFDRYNKYLYVLMIFTISVVASSVMSQTDIGSFYMIPYTLISVYLLAFFSRRMVYTVYVLSLVPLLIFAPDGIQLFFIYLLAGVVCIQVFESFSKGWLQFVMAFIIFLVMAAVWWAFRLVEGIREAHEYRQILEMFAASMLSVALYPMIYLFEKMFRLVSTSRLVELSDTSNTLLRLLADKAPGTFQHSLQVMNLADAAARSIGANVPLVRAGALYHDIGKIANPQCFTENETPGIRYHEGLSPKDSAQEIIRHVSDGMELAEKHGLPGVLRDFIVTHHGTGNTGYFYTRYLNEGGDPADVAAFHYKGRNPVTKEQVVLMICDSVEAASRSLKDYSKESISALVDGIVAGKEEQGQLKDADISLRELSVLKEVIKEYLQQMYHSRVSYPKREQK